MQKVKIVFTDLDSTLTNELGQIDIKNKNIFEKLGSIGVPIVINTGRALPYIIPICKQFSTSNYVIASNGAEIYNFLTKKVIFRSTISKENLNKLDELIEKYELFFTANGIEKRYTNKEDKKGRTIVKKLSEINDDVSQIVLESFDIEKMKYLRRDIENETNLKIANKTKHIKEGKLLYYDIVNSDTGKGKALKILCEYLNIDSNKAMAIGDADNDIDMFLYAGYKVAVANASEKLKEKADVITLSNRQNGVYTILNELYSNIK